jgi:polar amino acid transport system substrate-binding protein
MRLRGSAREPAKWTQLAVGMLAAFIALQLAPTFATTASAATLERIRTTGRIRLGYLRDAPPFSFSNQANAADGYAVALCKSVAEHLTKQLALPGLTLDWKPVTFERRLSEVQQSGIDLLCAPTSVTLSRRKEVSFSIPIFAGGNRAAVRANASTPLRRLLSEAPPAHPVWRGTPAATVLQQTTFAYVPGTTAEKWLQERHRALQVETKIESVADYRKGLQQLNAGDIDVLLGDRVVMLGTLGMLDSFPRENILILDRMFTHEPAALALARGDDDFRLLVDGALSRVYASAEFPKLYAQWCGEFDERTRAFFVWNVLQP